MHGPSTWQDYNRRAKERLGAMAAKESAAASKWRAIATQAPDGCDEIGYQPGPPTLIIYNDRRTGCTRIFKLTLQWTLEEVQLDTVRPCQPTDSLSDQ
jgi:hypothetical protein